MARKRTALRTLAKVTARGYDKVKVFLQEEPYSDGDVAHQVYLQDMYGGMIMEFYDREGARRMYDLLKVTHLMVYPD